ncbi:MAG: SAM-dependent methyltransferase [Clostridia bacterium]|nr:SAM-dependent methyltransferase [Clostridia bacterium]
MNKRLTEIFSVLPDCDTFADVGCDHGYMTLAMLKAGKCKRAIISDISEKCLQKARELLSGYILDGRVDSVVCDGLEKVGKCDLALIAGMGGEEIISIVKNAPHLPENLVLQPMKNVDKVRVACVEAGYRIEKDYVFFASGIYYNLILLQKGEDKLSQEEIEFGRTNLLEKGGDFKAMLYQEIEKYKVFLNNDSLPKESRAEMQARIEKLERYV